MTFFYLQAPTAIAVSRSIPMAALDGAAVQREVAHSCSLSLNFIPAHWNKYASQSSESSKAVFIQRDSVV
jgi:hypothetical protein